MEYSRSELLRNAKRALGLSYAPYSRFNVGAAILCDDGSYISAANVEFSVSAIGMCAERLALSAARMQKKTPTHITICTHYDGVTDFGDDPKKTPCGLCRQAMVEFDGLKQVTKHRAFSVKNLLPKAYTGRKART